MFRMRKRISKLSTSLMRLDLKEARLRTADGKLVFLGLGTDGESQLLVRSVRDERCACKESHTCPIILRHSNMQRITHCFLKRSK